MPNVAKVQSTTFQDLYLPNHPVLLVIEDHLEKIGGLDPKEVRKDDAASVVFHFRAGNISVVIRLYRYVADLTYYLHLEAAFALAEPQADLAPISRALTEMNGEMPCPIRVGRSGEFLVSQGWFHLTKFGEPKWIPNKEDFWWLPEVLVQLTSVAVEAKNRIKDCPGYSPLPEPKGARETMN